MISKIVVKDTLARVWLKKGLEGEMARLRRSMANEPEGSEVSAIRARELDYLRELSEAIINEPVKA